MTNFINKLHAVVCFYSRIVLNRFRDDEKVAFRKMENLLKVLIKINADIQLLNVLYNKCIIIIDSMVQLCLKLRLENRIELSCPNNKVNTYWFVLFPLTLLNIMNL